MLEQQKRAEEIAAMYKPLPIAEWERQSSLPEYIMESNIFEFEMLKQSENFGIKKY